MADGRLEAAKGALEALVARLDPTDNFGLVTFDDTAVDGVVNGTGTAFGGMSNTFRRVQTGFVRSYALSVLAGAVLVVVALLAVNLA